MVKFVRECSESDRIEAIAKATEAMVLDEMAVAFVEMTTGQLREGGLYLYQEMTENQNYHE